MRLLPAFALLALPGCQSETPAASNHAAPSEAAVISELSDDQAVIANQIESDAEDEAGNEAAGTAEGDHYGCDDGTKVTARYSEDGAGARLLVDGKLVTLSSVTSASGAKYATNDKRVIWWSKDDGAMLIRGEGTPQAVTATCKEAD